MAQKINYSIFRKNFSLLSWKKKFEKMYTLEKKLFEGNYKTNTEADTVTEDGEWKSGSKFSTDSESFMLCECRIAIPKGINKSIYRIMFIFKTDEGKYIPHTTVNMDWNKTSSFIHERFGILLPTISTSKREKIDLKFECQHISNMNKSLRTYKGKEYYIEPHKFTMYPVDVSEAMEDIYATEDFTNESNEATETIIMHNNENEVKVIAQQKEIEETKIEPAVKIEIVEDNDDGFAAFIERNGEK